MNYVIDLIKNSILFCILFTASLLCAEKNMYIYAPNWDFSQYTSYINEKGELTYSCRDQCCKQLIMLKESLRKLGYNLSQIDHLNNLSDFDYLICFDPSPHIIPQLLCYPKEKRILFLWEPPIVNSDIHNPHLHSHFSKVFTILDNEVKQFNYIKIYNEPMPTFTLIHTPISFEKRKFCTMLTSNRNSSHPNELFSKRKEFIEFCEKLPNDIFDFYGMGWNSSYKNYRGYAESKAEVYTYYKFAIIYENSLDIDGYISAEKLFFPMLCGCIPVYLGPQNITDYVSADCFICARQFKSSQELYAYLNNIDQRRYEKYIDAINTFLASPAAHRFSCENFVDIVLSNLLPGYPKEIAFNQTELAVLNFIGK